MQQVVLDNVGCHSGEIAGKGKRPDFAGIPEELDFFQSHCGNAGSRTDYQNRTACACAICHEFPEKGIRGKLCKRVHAHGGGHKGNIIYDSRTKADDNDDYRLVSDFDIKPLSQCREHAVGGKGGYCEQNADEENHRRHINAFERLGQSEVLLLFIRLAAMKNVTYKPKHTEGEQNTEVRGQMRNCLEHRNEDQGADTHKEHQGLFETVK